MWSQNIYCMYSTDVLEKGIIYLLGRIELDTGFHHATHNGVQLKNYECLLLELFFKYFWTEVDHC